MTVLPVSGYRVKPLLDETYTCGGYVFDENVEITKAKLNILNLDNSGASTCSAPLVEVKLFQEYSSSPACKIYRIRYTFIEKCLPFCTPAESAVGYQNFDQNGIYTNYGSKGNGYYQAASCTNGGMVFGYERYIMINDHTAPTSTPPANRVVPFPNGRCTFDFPAIALSGVDRCDDNTLTHSNLSIDWNVYGPTGSLLAHGIETTTETSNVIISNSALNGLAGGIYTVDYTVSDFCSNGQTIHYTFTVTGKDEQTPSILAHVKEAVLGSFPGAVGPSVKVIVSDVLNNLSDNCTPYNTLLQNTRLQKAKEAGASIDNPIQYTDPSVKSELVFTCSEIGLNKVRVWTKDLAGNVNYDSITVNVQYTGTTPCT